MCYYDNKQQLHKAARFFGGDGFESEILKYNYRKPKNENSVITPEQTEVGDQRNIRCLQTAHLLWSQSAGESTSLTDLRPDLTLWAWASSSRLNTS